MQKTNIEWTEYSWNPFKGKCPVKCKLPDGEIYCYGHKIYDRFSWMEEATGDYGALAEWELLEPRKLKKPSKIFVCSTFELFYHKNDEARDEIFKVIEDNPQHTFQILTKMPENIDRPMPDNVHLGVSVTDHDNVPRIKELLEKQARIKFVSIEPFLYPIYMSAEKYFGQLNWIIIGRLTGYGHKYNPKLWWIKSMVTFAETWKIPVFLKNNLKDIWGEDLIQEFPK